MEVEDTLLLIVDMLREQRLFLEQILKSLPPQQYHPVSSQGSKITVES